ncbi:MAG: hypothetical protein HC859_04715 [Bacteroidia bacterium]|nr:hypothetical protein [Bacteroidia bacterium]
MELRNMVRNVIIGKHNYIESYNLFKRVMLSGSFSIVAIVALTLYFTIDLLTNTYETLPVYGVSICLLLCSVYLNRKGSYCNANYFLFPTLNATVYLFASSESPHTGAFLLFIPSTLAAFAVFGYTQRLFSILMAISSYVLFVSAYFFDFPYCRTATIHLKWSCSTSSSTFR